MKIFKFNQYQIQNSESIDNTCTQCCATPKIQGDYTLFEGEKSCISATSKSDCDSKTAADFGFDDLPNINENNPFYKKPTFGGIVDGSSTATCYFDKDGDGCYSILTCQKMKKPGKSLTECECKDECEGESGRGGEFSQYPPSHPSSPCGGIFINGKCGNCEDQEEPDLPTNPGFPPGQGGGGGFTPTDPTTPDWPPTDPPPPSPPPPPPSFPSPNPPSPPSPPGGPSLTCPEAHTIEVASAQGFNPSGGSLLICEPNNPSSCFTVNYEYIYGNVFIGIYNNNQSIMPNYTVTQDDTVTTAVTVGVISYDSCGLDSNGDLICCPENWTYSNGKCCPPV
jgi:hypothetical protein